MNKSTIAAIAAVLCMSFASVGLASPVFQTGPSCNAKGAQRCVTSSQQLTHG